MKVELEKSFVIEAAVADCWQLLSDIPRVATCMPGASITQVIDASHFVGLVMVSIGPMRLQFAGDLELDMIDASAYKLVLIATGTDKSGSSATMKLTATLVEKENHQTLLHGQAEVTVNGQLAQFGSRMIAPYRMSFCLSLRITLDKSCCSLRLLLKHRKRQKNQKNLYLMLRFFYGQVLKSC